MKRERPAKFFTPRNIAYLAVLTALVVLFQTVGGFIQIGGLSLSFVLVPIVLGGILLGWGAGAFLGFVFGFIVLMYGVAGAEPFTAALLADSPFMTVLICLVKGIAAGVVPALLYRLIARKNRLAAAIVASLSAPVMNTGLFIVGCLIISGTIAGFTAHGTMDEIVYFLFIGCAGWNFIIEFAINIVLAPAIHRVVLVAERSVRAHKGRPVSERALFAALIAVMCTAAAVCVLLAVLVFCLAADLWWVGLISLLVGLAVLAECLVCIRIRAKKGIKETKS